MEALKAILMRWRSQTPALQRNLTSADTSPMSRVRMVIALLLKIVAGSVSAGLAWYLSFVIHYKLKQSRKKLPLPPGPTPLPLIGSLDKTLSSWGPDGQPAIHRSLATLGKKYNGLYGLYFGNVYSIVITDPAVAEEAFTTQKLPSGERGRGKIFTDRSPFQSRGAKLAKAFDLFTRGGLGIALSFGKYNASVRGRVVGHISNDKMAQRSTDIITEEVESVLAEFRRKIMRGEKLDTLTAELKRESLNIAFRVLFSKRFGAGSEECREIGELVAFFFDNLVDPIDYLPIADFLPFDTRKEFKKQLARRDAIIGKIVRERLESFMQLRSEGKMNDRSDARDVADLYLFDHVDGFEQKREDGSVEIVKFTLDQVEVNLWDIIFAFGDTTALTNEYFIVNLINNPECQRKLHEELDRVCGPDRLPTEADKGQLPYFWACIKETMRLRILSPLMNPHYANQETTLHDNQGNEFTIPEGTQVFLHGFSMGLDPDLWENPEEFIPERWFKPENEGLDLHGQVRRLNSSHYKFVPFSMGPRMCPGYAFAKVAVAIQSAAMAHCFRFRLTEDAEKLAKPGQLVGGKLDMLENFGLSITPQPHAEDGLITADIRAAAFLAKPAEGDIDYKNCFLEKDQRKKVRLCSKEMLSADTSLLRFSLGDTTQVLGLPIGKHFKVILPNLAGVEEGKWNGRPDSEAGRREIQRSYTPTSCDADAGFVDLVVKHYNPGVKKNFPDGGKCSQQLGQLFVGDEIEIQGPFGRVEYKGRGMFKIGSKQMKRRKVGMMAGGSGITPMLQVVVAALKDSSDDTQFSLIYANQTEEDILLRDTLEKLSNKNPERFKLHYTLDRPPKENWKYSTGFIDMNMISAYMPPPSDDTIVLMCGPPPMIKFACRANLDKLGYSKDSMVEF